MKDGYRRELLLCLDRSHPLIMHMKFHALFLAALVCTEGLCACGNQLNALRVHDLNVEHLRNPIQLDMAQPRLSWKIRTNDPEARNIQQESYRILVASNPDTLANDTGDLWDSGPVTSSQSVLVPYQGRDLQSRQTCYWKVRISDNRGQESDWSDVACWEMALLEPTDWAGSQWIGLENNTRDHPLASRLHQKQNNALRSHLSPLLRKEVTLRGTVRRARAYVSGIGYSEFYINGNKVSDHVLDPGQTNYETHTLYVVHDVTAALTPGKNALGFWLGNGFYGQHLAFDGKFGYGKPRVRAKLVVEYTDGSTDEFATDTSWKATASPIVFDNVYWGETYDARLEIDNWATTGLDDSAWSIASVVPAPCPDAQLRPQLVPPIREMERLKPVDMRQVEPGTWLLDFGRNIAGWIQISVHQEAGDVIKLFPAEVLNQETGRADQVTMGGAPGRPHEVYYICRGKGEETWAPRFTYSGFQYVEISGLATAPDADSVEAVFVRSAVEKTGSFASSNELLNKQYAASLLSLEGNWHSVPEDCPHREKCGWLGDAHATADLSLYNYDMARFYLKFIRDIEDSLRADTITRRVIPDTAGVPTMVAPGKRANRVATIDWGVAYILLPWRLYVHTGDINAFKPHFQNIKNAITYYQSFKNEHGVIDNGLGDWCPPRWDRRLAPEHMACHPYVSGTAFYFQALRIAGRMARLLNDEAYSAWCLKEADTIRDAFNRVYLESIEGTDLKHYGSQTATVMALNLGMVPPDQIQPRVSGLVYDINERHAGHHACGIHGLRHLYTVLADHGQPGLAYRMLTDTTFPSPGYVLSCGLSTWPERRFEWKKERYRNSFNHPMNGGFAAFMHESLGGIRPDTEAAGYKHVRLKPQLTDQLGWVKTSVESPYGRIRSEWMSAEDQFVWEVEIPVNVTATLLIPHAPGKELSQHSDGEFLAAPSLHTESQRQWLKCEVGSGVHRFTHRFNRS